jgi:glycosyltransferase involved in cell wall biosynthesis
MKVSIVHAVLNSHEIVKRQLLHYGKLGLPDDVEVIIVDDGSEPEIKEIVDTTGLNFNFTLYETHDKRPWTQPAARNFGARMAKGEYCIFTDIDHIVTKKVVEEAINPKADVIRFRREVAVLDENGNFVQSMNELRKWGYVKDGFKIAPHGNSYIFRRDLFLELGGVDTSYVGTGKYPNREEVPLKHKIKKLWDAGKITVIDTDPKPTIYMMPNGRYCGDKDANPFGLFHGLSRSIRESRKRQAEYKEQCATLA